MDRKQQLLARLDAIGQSLKTSVQALALLGLGSVGTETDRIDDYSDLDFFAIVKAGTKTRFLDDLDWLSTINPIAYAFPNTADGYKLLYEDGIFCEFAVFEPSELTHIPFPPGRIVWKAEGFDEAITTPQPIRQHERSVEWLLGEALTNLYVGLGRFHRGEKLSATYFIQNYAVGRITDLAPHIETAQPFHADRFGGERRFEVRYPNTASHLPSFAQGYERNIESAQAILAFLEQHFEVNPAIRAAILALCVKK
jgi:lincosamide nucleotidyltransferase B/F